MIRLIYLSQKKYLANAQNRFDCATLTFSSTGPVSCVISTHPHINPFHLALSYAGPLRCMLSIHTSTNRIHLAFSYTGHLHRTVDWLLEFYVVATSKIISGWALTCDSAHLWRLYSAVPLGDQAISIVTDFPLSHII